MRRYAASLALVVAAVGWASPAGAQSDELEKELKSYVDEALASGEVGAKRAGLLTWGQFADAEAREKMADYKTDKSLRVRLAAGLGLHAAGDDEAQKFLLEQLRSESDLYPLFRDQLTVAPDDVEVELAEKLVDSTEGPQRRGIMRYLGEQHGPLYELLGDYLVADDKAVRKAAYQSVRASGRSRAFEFVDRLRTSDDASLQKKGLDLAVELSRYPGRRERAVEAIEPYLEHDDAGVAIDAASRLFELGSKAGVERLLSLLEESDSVEVKKRAARTLLEHDVSPPTKRVKPLYKAAKPSGDGKKKEKGGSESADEELRQMYLELTVASGDDATVDKLKKMFGSTTFDKRLVAAKALGRADASEALELLGKALFEGNPDMRLAAAKSFRQLESPQSLRYLERSIDQERNQKVKVEVIRTLGVIGNEKALRLLRFNSRTDNPTFKRAIIEAVRDAGRSDGLETLQLFRSARNLDLQWQAFVATADISPEKASEQVERMFRNPPDNFVRDLERLDLSAQKLLYEDLLRFDNARVREAVRESAQRTGEPLRSLLREAMLDSDVPTSTRRALVVHFSEMKTESDRPRFAKIVRDAEEASLVRRAAWTLTEYDADGLEATFRGFLAKDDPILTAIGAYGLAGLKL